MVLQRVTKATSGDYQCEVIGEHPKFRKETRKARLTIFCEYLLDSQSFSQLSIKSIRIVR